MGQEWNMNGIYSFKLDIAGTPEPGGLQPTRFDSIWRHTLDSYPIYDKIYFDALKGELSCNLKAYLQKLLRDTASHEENQVSNIISNSCDTSG